MSENWVRILSTGGAAGVLVFAVSFLLKWQSQYMKDAPPAWRRSVILVFLGTWSVIFVAAGLIMYVGVRNQIKDEAIIRGRLVGLGPTMDFESLFDALYLRRVAKTQSQAAFSWLIVSQEKLSGTMVDLLVDRGSSDHADDIADCELPIKDDFYRHEVILKYDSKNRVLMEDGVPLKCASAVIAAKRSDIPVKKSVRFQFIPAAFAQAPAAKTGNVLESMTERLESGDALVRLLARADLAAAGSDGVPYIEEVLGKPKNSYRLLLGAVVALNNMKGQNELSPRANCAIAQAASSDDDTLREQARKYVAQHSKFPLPSDCKQNFIATKVPVLPAKFKAAKAVYIDNLDDIASSSQERQAVVVLEQSIRDWGGLKVVSDPRLADVVLKVESFGSEDTLTVYDARTWPSNGGFSVWRMSSKNGLQGKNAPLPSYLQKSFGH